MKTRSYREIIKILKKHDTRFNVSDYRGKGSHRMIVHPDILGKERHYPIKFHGDKTEIYPGYQKSIIRHFNLPQNIFD